MRNLSQERWRELKVSPNSVDYADQGEMCSGRTGGLLYLLINDMLMKIPVSIEGEESKHRTLSFGLCIRHSVRCCINIIYFIFLTL